MRTARAAILLAACMLAACRPREGDRAPAGTLKTAIRPARVASASFEGVRLVFDVELDNASLATLTVASIDYEVELATRPWTDYEPWTKGTTGQGAVAQARTKSLVSIAVDLPADRLRKVLPLAAIDPQVGYIIRATVHFDAGQGRIVRVPLRGQSILAIPIVPPVALNRLVARRLDADGAELDLQIRITNSNAFRTTILRLEGEVALAGKRVGTIDLEPKSVLAPGGVVNLSAPLVLDFRRLGPGLREALDSGKVDVRLAGKAHVITPYGQPTFVIDTAHPIRVRHDR